MKRIGFLSFGHWGPVQGSHTRTARDALLQGIDLAVAAEELGIDGAFFRVHHFARQQASPFPLLAAIAARTSRIELGTAVVDMRYENPLYMAEEAAATDLISGGRLQLGISRGSPEPAKNGAAAFGYLPRDGETEADMARRHAEEFRRAVAGAGVVEADPRYAGGATGLLPIQPRSEGLGERIWWGAGTRKTAVWAAQLGMNLMSSTLLTEDTGVPFDELQAEQIALFREAWAAAGHSREPRVSVSRSVLPSPMTRIVNTSGSVPCARAGTRWAPSTAPWPASARAISASLTSLPGSWPRTPPCRRPTPSCSLFRTSWASSTTPRCWGRSPGTSRRRLAGSRNPKAGYLPEACLPAGRDPVQRPAAVAATCSKP